MKFLKISDIKLRIEEEESLAFQKAHRAAGLQSSDIISEKILKYSIDARKKEEIHKIYTIGITTEKPCKKSRQITILDKEPAYHFQQTGTELLNNRPIVVGFGPAGMFCAYMLAKYGYRPIIIERGSEMNERIAKVQRFWEEGILDEECNVQFGEGGAGTFSDGKLNTGIKDKKNRIRLVLETFVQFGAAERITYDTRPHIGTDVLSNVVVNMRNYIKAKGGEFYFDTALSGIHTENGHLVSIDLSNGETLPVNHCILAIGHSARDTFRLLEQIGVSMEQKPFAVGVRVEHKQSTINQSQYGFSDNRLGAAPYKLTYKTGSNRGVYSFCMCPGGYVVNASSQKNMLAVNGMSYSHRDGLNANSAIVVTISPKDFKNDMPLSGMEFQMELERKAYEAGKGKIPVQKLIDFKSNIVSKEFGRISPQMKGAFSFADINDILPKYICDSIREAIEYFGTVIQGFHDDDVILSAVESRTSSPVRILRNENFQSSIAGLYPAGEGAGYAGGITSAAIDGIKIFEYIATRFKPFT